MELFDIKFCLLELGMEIKFTIFPQAVIKKFKIGSNILFRWGGFYSKLIKDNKGHKKTDVHKHTR